MWNVWLGLKLITGAGEAVTPTSPITTWGKVAWSRKQRLQEQVRREDGELMLFANELIGRL